MKKLIVFACMFSLLISLFPMHNLYAAETALTSHPDGEVVVSETIENYADGSSLLIVISEEPAAPSNARATYSKSGTKTYNLRNSDGEILWQFMVHGTFTYTKVAGSKATCTEASHSYNILDNDWNHVSSSSYKSGNSAVGSAEFNRKLLFITVETETCTISLSCDEYGNFS